jgi:MFS family permease
LIYQSFGWNSGSRALVINGIQAVMQLLVVLVNTLTVDRFGRRALLLCGFGIQTVAILILSCLTTAFPNNDNEPVAIVEVAMLFVFGLTYCWSNGPVATVVVSEIFPQHVRDRV